MLPANSGKEPDWQLRSGIYINSVRFYDNKMSGCRECEWTGKSALDGKNLVCHHKALNWIGDRLLCDGHTKLQREDVVMVEKPMKELKIEPTIDMTANYLIEKIKELRKENERLRKEYHRSGKELEAAIQAYMKLSE